MMATALHPEMVQRNMLGVDQAPTEPRSLRCVPGSWLNRRTGYEGDGLKLATGGGSQGV